MRGKRGIQDHTITQVKNYSYSTCALFSVNILIQGGGENFPPAMKAFNPKISSQTLYEAPFWSTAVNSSKTQFR